MNENENFISKYQETYGVFPSRYAIRAYDLTLDLLYRLGLYSNIEQSIGNPTGAKLLENNFDYQKYAQWRLFKSKLFCGCLR